MSLQDQHLQQALKHAPDSELTPSDIRRAAVLAYADNALKQAGETWLSRLSNVWRKWFGASWHITGIGSAVATVLVVVIFWHELPDDSMRKVAASSDKMEVSESVVDGVTSSVDKRVVTEANAEKILQKKSTQVTAPRKEKSSLSVVPQAPAPILKESQAPVAAAPAEASTPSLQDNAVAQSVPAGMISLPETAQPLPKVALDKSVTSSTKLDARISKLISPKEGVADLLVGINSEGGVVTANKDIQALRLRLLALDEQSVQANGACPPPSQHPFVIDTTTGYNIETLRVCNVSTSLSNEVEAYNQTMRNWHAKHENK
ncbi:hypothetical protein [Methylotenera sp.]|uniref:hypothetical protein n=1 Tax=Methylotenera sp. TaxID=2051956 RepID=UPI0024879528|nr:hypothetical protein [Methylotenera sp.]MDI1360801.1 hypothetical protein [Methylotenera sp.]